MRVRVVLLRHRGRKLAEDELKTASEHVGHLKISPSYAELGARPDGPITILPNLIDPQIRHLRGDEFVIVGSEVVPGGRLGDRWQQAWWCRLAPG